MWVSPPRRRGPRHAAAVALLALGLAPAPAAADVLLDETFAGPTAAAPMRVGGSFVPCLTASADPAQGNVPGCPAGQPSIPAGGDPAGSGALRLTDNARDRSGFALYDRIFPSTQGLRFTFTTFAYNGLRVPGYGAADGISVFLADGAVGARGPGAFGGSLGYAQKAIDFDGEVPDIGGVPGGWLGVGIDEFGNFANDREARGYGCARRVDRDIHPDHLSIRGRGVPGSDWMRGYCLLARTPAPPPGVISQPDATTRTAPGVPHTFQLVVDPLMSSPGVPNPDARVRLLADMTGAGVFVAALDAPLPPDRPETFEFGLAASTGDGTNVHEVRAVRVETIDRLPAWTIAKDHAEPLVAGSRGAFSVRVALSAAGGAAYAPVVVDDALPPGLALAATPHGSGWTCDEAVAGATRARCTYEISRAEPVVPGTPLPALTVPVRVAPDADGRAVNVATLSGPEIPDPIDAEDPFELRRRVNVRVDKEADPVVLAPGGRTAFTLVVRNDGPSDARDVVLVDRPPDGLRLIAARASQGDCARVGERFRCELGTVRAGASALVLVDAEAAAGTAGRTLRNVAGVSAPHDDDPSDDRSEATVRVTDGDTPPPQPPGGRAVLEVEKRAERASARVGEPVAFTITVRNTGDAPASDVVLTDSTNMPGTIAAAPELRRACERSGTVVRCRLGTVAAGETVTLRATVVYRRAGRAVNAVALAPPYGTLPERIDVAGVSVTGGAALRISKRADRTRVRRGDTVRFRVGVRSVGSDPARRVRVCDLLPPRGLRLASTSGPGRRTVSSGRRRVCWRLPLLAPGRAVSFTVAARVTGGPGRVRNVAIASARNARPVRALRPLRISAPQRPAYTG